MKYLASSAAGLVYEVDGSLSSERLPFWIGQNNAARTRNGEGRNIFGLSVSWRTCVRIRSCAFSTLIRGHP